MFNWFENLINDFVGFFKKFPRYKKNFRKYRMRFYYKYWPLYSVTKRRVDRKWNWEFLYAWVAFLFISLIYFYYSIFYYTVNQEQGIAVFKTFFLNYKKFYYSNRLLFFFIMCITYIVLWTNCALSLIMVTVICWGKNIRSRRFWKYFTFLIVFNYVVACITHPFMSWVVTGKAVILVGVYDSISSYYAFIFSSPCQTIYTPMGYVALFPALIIIKVISEFINTLSMLEPGLVGYLNSLLNKLYLDFFKIYSISKPIYNLFEYIQSVFISINIKCGYKIILFFERNLPYLKPTLYNYSYFKVPKWLVAEGSANNSRFFFYVNKTNEIILMYFNVIFRLTWGLGYQMIKYISHHIMFTITQEMSIRHDRLLLYLLIVLLLSSARWLIGEEIEYRELGYSDFYYPVINGENFYFKTTIWKFIRQVIWSFLGLLVGMYGILVAEKFLGSHSNFEAFFKPNICCFKSLFPFIIYINNMNFCYYSVRLLIFLTWKLYFHIRYLINRYKINRGEYPSFDFFKYNALTKTLNFFFYTYGFFFIFFSFSLFQCLHDMLII